jgi:long-chain acyl-CoA synthetase
LGNNDVPGFTTHLKDITLLERIIMINGNYPAENPLFMDFNAFDKLGESITVQGLRDRRAALTPDMVATYVYTSGTTGPPKAAMLSHKNYYAAAASMKVWTQFLTTAVEQVKTTCFLTLAHVFERNVSLLTPLVTGACVYFADLSKAMDELRLIQPTIVMGLPRTWEKVYETIMAKRDTMPGRKQKIFNWALQTGQQYNKCLYEKKPMALPLRVKYSVANTLVIKKILDGIGCFNEAKHILTGGAVSSKEIIDFFFSLGLWICQVYGQTEALGMASGETRENMRFGSVGKPFPFTEIRIADDGEIMVKSDMVSPGYYKDSELTNETFRNGWLYSGDLGYIDPDGYVFITGRKKDIIITSGAKNITPSKIEASLMSVPLVEHAVVAGDGKKYLTALITLSFEDGQNFAKKKGLEVRDYKSLITMDGLKEELERHIAAVNEKYSRVEQIKKFTILPAPLSIEGGELTSLNKIKRFAVIQKYVKEIDEMYK